MLNQVESSVALSQEISIILSEATTARTHLQSMSEEFDQVELKFNDFDFNSQMIETLSNSQDYNVSPFANLFNKHVGSLVERFRFTEAAYNKLVNKLAELIAPRETEAAESSEEEENTQHARIQIDLHSTSHKTAQTLPGMLNNPAPDHMAETSPPRREARKSSLSSSDTSSKSFTPEQLLGSLNTAQVCRDLREMAKKHSINRSYLASRFKHTATAKHFNTLLSEPKPWEELSETDKLMCRRMHLLTKLEPGQIAALKRLSSKFVQRACLKSKKSRGGVLTRMRVDVKSEQVPAHLNTFTVAHDLTELAERHSISRGYLAHRLRLSQEKFNMLLNEPRGWSMLGGADKLVYTRMHRLVQATSEQLAALKRCSNARTHRTRKPAGTHPRLFDGASRRFKRTTRF